MTSTAAQVVFKDRNQVAVVNADLPRPGSGQLLVRTRYSVISPGTELALLRALPNTTPLYPFYPGYSAAGIVEEIGPDVTEFQADDRIVANMPHASRALVDKEQCWRLPERLKPREAAAFRLVSIALQGVRKAQVQLGETVFVIGLGMIGNLAGQLARAAGATRVIGIDPLESRRELALGYGFESAFSPEELPEEAARCGKGCPQVVIEATGVPQAVNAALEAAAPLGRVVLLGSTRGITTEVNFYLHVHRKGLHIIGAHDDIRARTENIGLLWTPRDDAITALDLLADGRVRVDHLLSASYRGEDAPAAYKALLEPGNALLCAELDWTG